MDVKTLSTIIGHVSAKTTLSIYTHVTDAMRQTAAAKIDRSIGKREPRGKSSSDGKGLSAQTPDTHSGASFVPYKGKIRKPGTGCVTQINDHLWEGRYSPKWPDGKKHPRNIYARTEDECEEKLAELIQQTKAEIAEANRLATEGKWEEAMALAGQDFFCLWSKLWSSVKHENRNTSKSSGNEKIRLKSCDFKRIFGGRYRT